MHAFDHVIVLLSFVYALALTHLLSRMAGLFIVRSRVKISWLLFAAMVNAIVSVFFDWLALWSFRDASSWDLSSIALQFAFAISAYFMCALAAPEAEPEGTIDLEAFYWQQRRAFYWIYLSGVVIATATNFTFLKTPDPSQAIRWTIAAVPMLPAPILGLALRARWAQWAAAAGVFFVTLGLLLVFEGVLR